MSDKHPCSCFPIAAAAAALVGVLSACGGSSGGITAGDSPRQPDGPSSAPAVVTLNGVAATGAPLAGATVSVTDSLGATVCDTTTADTGAYLCTLPSSARAPFAIQAQLERQRLYSAQASADGGTANITPLTTLIVARLAPGGDPANLAEAIRADAGVVTETTLQAKVDEIKRLLAPVLAATGDDTDPLRGTFVANGVGHDQVLDALQVSIRPEAGASNIEVTVKTRPSSDNAAPVALAFRSNAESPPSLAGTIRSDDLVDPAIVGLLNGLAGRFTACYAEPLSQRIAGVSPGATQAVGTAASVQAPSCKGLFIDGDPTRFLDNGAVVGSSGAFSGMFRDSSTRASFDRFAFEYQWANGDMYITFRSRTVAGVEARSALTVRKQGGQLKVVGNQYVYDGAIRPYAATREFPAQPQFTWLGSGYNVALRNTIDPVTQLPILREALVTAPDGRTSIYRPLAGRSALGIVGAGGQQRVNQVQFLGSEFLDTQTPGTPMDRDGASGAYFVAPQLGDDALRTLPDQGVWTVEFVHADPSRENVRQTYRTLRRAPTVSEVRRMRFAELTPAFSAELVARLQSSPNGSLHFGDAEPALSGGFHVATTDAGDGWAVPDDALAPTSVTIFGHGPDGGAFNDSTTVGSTERRATVNCSTQSAHDFHCDRASGTPQFAAGGRASALELWVRDERQLELGRLINLYRLAD